METQTPATEPEIEALPAPKQDLRKTWIIAGAATIIALAGAMVGVKALDKKDNTPVQAAGTNAQAFGQRPTSGPITAIDGSSFTVKVTDFTGATSSQKVSTSSATTYSESVTGAVSDLKKGDNIVATGTTADGVLTATRVSQSSLLRTGRGGDGPRTFTQGGPPPDGSAPDGAIRPNGGVFSSGNVAVGEITAIDGNSITITDPSGATTTVKTTDATTVTVTKKIAFKDLTVGDTVRVAGTTSGDTVKASDVTKGDAGGGFFGGPQRITTATTPAS